MPTLHESGMPGFELEGWYGLMAPACTPDAIVGRMSGEVAKAMNSDEIKAALAAQGARPLEGGPEKLASYLRSEIERYTTIIKAINLKAE